MENLSIRCETRQNLGTKASRQIRRDGKIPAVLYGGKKETVHLVMDGEEVENMVQTASRFVQLELGAESQEAMVRDVQYDTYGEFVQHIDFLRLIKGEKIEVDVPIRLKGQSAGARKGGIQRQHLHNLTLLAAPVAIPKELVVDVTELQIGDHLDAKDLPLPDGATLITDPEERVAVITHAEEETEAEEGVVDLQREPEVISKGKTADEESEE